MDGAEWILEGTQKDNYHVVVRHSPNDDDYRKSGKYRDLCLYILKLSDLHLDNEKVY